MSFRLFPAQASDIAGDVDALYWFMVVITILVLAVIFLPMFFFLGKYRRGTKADRTPSSFSTLKLELTWTIIPLFIVMVMFGWGASVYVDMQKIPANTLDILVVGKQWMWYTQHPEGNREINELHVPVGRTVKLIMTSQDVIHSFYLPDFRVKQDVLPGRYTIMWFTATRAGVSHLFCTEYCGTKHSHMVGRIVAMDPRDYEQWLTTGNVSESVVQTGARLFRERGCSGCHASRSIVPAPPLEGLYGRLRPLQDGKMVRADDQYLHDSILLPQSQIAAGYAPVMPTYQGVLSPEEVLQIVAYIKSLAHVNPERLP